jgi:hypothetical protein
MKWSFQGVAWSGVVPFGGCSAGRPFIAMRYVAFFIPFDSQTVKIEDLNVEHI